MAEEYKLPYSGVDIYRRLRDVDTKANVAQMTSAEYEALSADEMNANTLYMIMDSEDNDEYYTQIQIDEKIEEVNLSIDNKADATHNHDEAYDVKGAASAALDVAKEYTDDTIESFANSKVNVSDIVDNLTTNAVNKPLSAAQGAVIKEMINEKASSSALSNYYTKTQIDNLELVTIADIDTICSSTIQVATLNNEVKF